MHLHIWLSLLNFKHNYKESFYLKKKKKINKINLIILIYFKL